MRDWDPDAAPPARGADPGPDSPDPRANEIAIATPTSGFSAIFGQRSDKGPGSLENFSSALVALAVNANPTPLLGAIAQRGTTSGDSTAAGMLEVDVGSLTSVRAYTQVYLPPQAGAPDRGYLDLVVTLEDGNRTQNLWIEVKVDAGLTLHDQELAGQRSLDQLDVYMSHRPARGGEDRSAPYILTLAREAQVRADVPGFRWQDLHDAAASVAAEDFIWREVRRFLVEQGITFAPLPASLADPIPFAPVFSAVDALVEKLWPPERVHTRLHTGQGRVPGDLRARMRDSGRIMLTAQCLSYGLRAHGEQAEWWIAVGNGSKYQGTDVAPAEVIDAAPEWFREAWALVQIPRIDRIDVFEKRLEGKAEAADAVSFLSEAMREIERSGVIQPYLAKKTGTSATPNAQVAPEP